MKKKTIAILGPKLSHTDLAYKRAKRIYLPTISAVFLAVIKGKAEYGLVPFKNTVSGIIRESAINFARYKEKIKIDKRFWVKISHVLAVLPNTREQDIDAIMTNRVIFTQCRKFLKKHFSKAKKIFSKTSSAAAEFLAKIKTRGMAVIVSKEAAKYFDFKVLKTRIEDSSDNVTEFVIFNRF